MRNLLDTTYGQIGVTHAGSHCHRRISRIDGERFGQTVQKHQIAGGVSNSAERVATAKSSHLTSAMDNPAKAVDRFGLVYSCGTKDRRSQPS